MPIIYIYKGTVMSNKGVTIGHGNTPCIPRTGDFLEIQSASEIYKVSAVMFKILLEGTMAAVVYLTDIMPETEEKLRKY